MHLLNQWESNLCKSDYPTLFYTKVYYVTEKYLTVLFYKDGKMDGYTAKSKSGPKPVNLEKKQCFVWKHSVHNYVFSVENMWLGHTEIENPHLCGRGTVSAFRPYFNPFYKNFQLKYLMSWLSICSLRSGGIWIA